jgi:hypothetical protein
MRKEIFAIVAIAALISGATAEADLSADYKQGYEDAAKLFKPLAYMDGALFSTKLLLDTFKKTQDDGGFAGAFASGFIEGVAPGYNEMALEYNELAAQMNLAIDLVLGPGHDDLKFDRAPLFY